MQAIRNNFITVTLQYNLTYASGLQQLQWNSIFPSYLLSLVTIALYFKM